MKKILVIASAMLFGFITAHAAGTAAGTVITNNASLTYEVGGTQVNTPVNSNDDVFVVDDKVDLTVVHQDGAAVTVTPGATAQALEFLVTNTGNKTHDFLLTAGQNDGNPFGENHPDEFDATNVQVFVESGANPGYQAAEDTATFIDELAADGTATVYIVSDIPNPLNVDDVAEMTLTAQVAVGGTAGTQGAAIATDDSANADTAGTAAGDEQIVFADAAGTNGATDAALDGQHGDTNAYKVQTATLDASKTSCAVWDPFTTTANYKRVPGAMVRYAIDVNNTGNADADNVVLTDNIPATVTFGQSPAAGAPAAIAEIRDAACNCATPAGNVVAADTVTHAAGTVTADYNTVTAGTHKCAYFDVFIP